TRTGLMPDDTQGIQSITAYGGARTYDAYNTGGTHNNSFASAASFTVNPTTLTAQLPNLDITTKNQVEYFKFVTPPGLPIALNLSIQSSGLSLLEPKVWVYNSAQAQIG